jgi:hypothetical protein
MEATLVHLTIDKFMQLKKKHGQLTQYMLDEGGDWKKWKHEFGYPERFYMLMFESGSVYNIEQDEAK